MDEVDARARAILECLEIADLTNKVGKLALYDSLPSAMRARFQVLRNDYRQDKKLDVAESNRRAAMDIVESIVGGDVPEPAAVASKARTKGQAALAVLAEAVREKGRLSKSRVGIARGVAWVSANILVPLDQMDAADVPGSEALTLWNWARANETEYRRLYDCKRIPVKGIAEDEEKGFIDRGEPIADIMDRLKVAVERQADVSMRDLQAAESDGNGSGRSGGVHGLPGVPAERSDAGGSGGLVGGPGGLVDEGRGGSDNGDSVPTAGEAGGSGGGGGSPADRGGSGGSGGSGNGSTPAGDGSGPRGSSAVG